MGAIRQLMLNEDENGVISLERPEARPDLTEAGTAAALAGDGAGNVDNGAHSYLVTFVSGETETDADGEDLGQVSVTVTNKTTNGKVALTDIPVGSAYVTARRIYRTKANADPNFRENYLLLDTIDDNTSTTFTDNVADSSLDEDVPLPVENSTSNSVFSFDPVTGQAQVAGLNPAALLLSGLGDAESYPKTTDGAQTLLAAAAAARVVLIIVSVTQTFADGDGAKPVFDIGETDTVEKFKADLNSGTAGQVFVYAGVLSANKALLVSATAATGTTSTGAIAVAALALPAAS